MKYLKYKGRLPCWPFHLPPMVLPAIVSPRLPHGHLNTLSSIPNTFDLLSHNIHCTTSTTVSAVQLFHHFPYL